MFAQHNIQDINRVYTICRCTIYGGEILAISIKGPCRAVQQDRGPFVFCPAENVFRYKQTIQAIFAGFDEPLNLNGLGHGRSSLRCLSLSNIRGKCAPSVPQDGFGITSFHCPMAWRPDSRPSPASGYPLRCSHIRPAPKLGNFSRAIRPFSASSMRNPCIFNSSAAIFPG